MKLTLDFFINELKVNMTVGQNLLSIQTYDQATWKPDQDKWCLLEIVCHLVDEEVLDFRTRLNTALYPDKNPFVPIDPVGWVTEKEYIKQDYQAKVNTWVRERETSIDWLNSLRGVDWNSFLIHDKLGEMSAHLFLENWLAHDYIHLRQIIRTKRAYLDQLGTEDLSYAGKW